MKKLYLFVFTILLTFLLPKIVLAKASDFIIDTNTEINYVTGNDYVTVNTAYIRTVKNRDYYFPASGEKVFHIPDLPQIKEEEVKTERDYKKASLSVVDTQSKNVKYTIEELPSGEGMYVKIPNFKQTTYSSPYIINFSYKTHDYVTKVINLVTLQAPALPKDVIFSQNSNGTATTFNYGLSIVTDKGIGALTKAFPSQYELNETNTSNIYTFPQTSRVENSPYLEFGTEIAYKFELEYVTPKTDNFIPEKYSNVLKALSTNIYELSLPREFSETNQRVYFSNVSPLPSSISQDEEGNIIATFEVPANEISNIKIEGYVLLKQNTISNTDFLWNTTFKTYTDDIKASTFLQKYLAPTKYWESTDLSIKTEADKLLLNTTTILDVIRADYKFVDDKLSYDKNKATSENERIGAKAALAGGASVCMEYADSMIAILRAQGIPARAAIGYANLSETPTEQGSQTRHQWVQVWVPEYGWLSVDPTLESNNMKIGQTIDRVLWEVFNNDNLSNISLYTADNVKTLDTNGYNLKIYAVKGDSVKTGELKTYIDLVPEKNYTSVSEIPTNSGYSLEQWFNTFIKTTTIGKSLIITGPILIILTILIIIISLVSFTIRRLQKKVQNTKQ